MRVVASGHSSNLWTGPYWTRLESLCSGPGHVLRSLGVIASGLRQNPHRKRDQTIAAYSQCSGGVLAIGEQQTWERKMEKPRAFVWTVGRAGGLSPSRAFYFSASIRPPRAPRKDWRDMRGDRDGPAASRLQPFATRKPGSAGWLCQPTPLRSCEIFGSDFTSRHPTCSQLNLPTSRASAGASRVGIFHVHVPAAPILPRRPKLQWLPVLKRSTPSGKPKKRGSQSTEPKRFIP